MDLRGSRRIAHRTVIPPGGTVPLSYALAPIFRYPVPYPPEPNILASFIALIPAFIGAYAGVLVRWLAFNTASQS